MCSTKVARQAAAARYLPLLRGAGNAAKVDVRSKKPITREPPIQTRRRRAGEVAAIGAVRRTCGRRSRSLCARHRLRSGRRSAATRTFSRQEARSCSLPPERVAGGCRSAPGKFRACRT